MNIFKSLKQLFTSPTMEDPDFGRLTFIDISKHPERSYWEAEWVFPPTGTPVGICLDGDESGPRPDYREWYLQLPSRYPRILEQARPVVAKELTFWLDQTMPDDVYQLVKIAGFSVKDPRAEPIEWDVAFETIGEKWLYINIPFVGDEPGEAVVDT